MESNLSNELEQLLEQREYFRFRDLLESDGDQLDARGFLLWTAYRESLFNECEHSNVLIEEFIDKYGDSASDEEYAGLLKLQADNFLRLYQYGDAAQIYEDLLLDHQQLLEPDEIKELVNNLHLCQAVSNVPAQQFRHERNVNLPFRKNLFGHIMVKAGTHSYMSDFIFDTGANFSTVSYSTANKMKLKLVNSAIEVGTSTGAVLNTSIGIAETFSVGEMVFSNVVFLVVPDQELSFDELNYNIEGIVGFPVIHQMREIRIGNNFITVPSKPVRKGLQNLCIEGMMPLVNAWSPNWGQLIFTLDTGANKSELSRRFYDRYKTHIETIGKKGISKRGGGGGVVEGETYEIHGFPLKVGSHNIKLEQISVTLENYQFSEFKDGNMGEDVFSRFGHTVICFEHMYLDFSDPKN